ncbi:G-protein coupled receptor Mth2-like [Sitodiplosis mosellana]|uniref:G-protein coupled receptor Mth2-like n=1 Tax=Sitodiplosis mosellana TaxID=263140 RepID=UPI0024449DDF|nr:G-protein coupled receptor Mth2-like [Sitodiplosis mosellana]
MASMCCVFRSKSLVTGLCLIIVFSSSSLSEEFPGEGEWCHTSERIDISDGVHDPNTNSITFNGTTFPMDQYVKMNNKTFGCLCEMTPCIRLCCPYGSFIKARINGIKCSDEQQEDAKNFGNSVRNENNELYDKDHFKYVDDQTCVKAPKYLKYWIQVTDNGQGIHDGRHLTRREYCFAIHKNDKGKIANGTLLCKDLVPEKSTRYVIPICMIISVIFLFATILVYLCIPELLNFVGKCVVCYLGCLTIVYIMLVLIHIKPKPFGGWACTVFSYIIYLFSQSTFAWTNVLSFDLWSNFRAIMKARDISDQKRFSFYILYVCIWASVITIIAGIFDSMKHLGDNFKPNFGDYMCYINVNHGTQSYLRFHYIPLCIIFAINMVLFVLSTVKIIRMQMDMKRSFSKEDGFQQQNTIKNKDKYMIFLRLSIVFGLNWFFEGIIFAIKNETAKLIFSILNGLIGVIIFSLFIMKRSVLKAIKKKWSGIKSGNNSYNTSNDTNESSSPKTPKPNHNIRLTNMARKEYQ